MVVGPSTSTLETYKDLLSINDQGIGDIPGNIWNSHKSSQNTKGSVHNNEWTWL